MYLFYLLLNFSVVYSLRLKNHSKFFIVLNLVLPPVMRINRKDIGAGNQMFLQKNFSNSLGVFFLTNGRVEKNEFFQSFTHRR